MATKSEEASRLVKREDFEDIFRGFDVSFYIDHSVSAVDNSLSNRS